MEHGIEHEQLPLTTVRLPWLQGLEHLQGHAPVRNWTGQPAQGGRLDNFKCSLATKISCNYTGNKVLLTETNTKTKNYELRSTSTFNLE